MDKQTTVIIIISVAVLFVLFLFIKNNRDRKKLITPDQESDVVNEENMDHHSRRDKL